MIIGPPLLARGLPLFLYRVLAGAGNVLNNGVKTIEAEPTADWRVNLAQMEARSGPDLL